MRFAKVFEVSGTQVLCLLQPSDEDGAPEVRIVTYVGKACVSFGNRLVEVGAEVENPDALFQKTKALFDEMDQERAENAYRLALELIQESAASEGGSSEPGGGQISEQFQLLNETGLRGSDIGGPEWTSLPMPSKLVH
jgi:hypothetical protein